MHPTTYAGLTRPLQCRFLVCFATMALLSSMAFSTAEIPPATDAPQPLPPAESAQRIKLPPGFRLEPVASEPLMREPSGVCWDERGRLFVCELHGYNLEGQYDIEALNKTGQLDREVRRIQADPRAKDAAKAGTYGTVKLLLDADGDGRTDKAEIFADRLPPCYGICPARGGLIVACAPDIIFLADRDGDGRAEVRETLFTGFATGALERGINQPQWGLDDWIYFGRGHGGGTITGPHLARPVQLGGADFRIKADGSVIEPVTGSTHTFGHAFTEFGDRFTSTTSVPGLYVTPLPWRYLARNPDAAAPRTEQSAGDYTRVFPAAPPHPWRTRRAQDPGFYKYYRDRYGAGDSDPGGWFTSACGPLVYQDVALPIEYRGQYFVCEPAQNLIHRAVLERDGAALRLRRAPGEETSEFLASSDPWFHPIHLAHGPDGAIWIVDMYREIIEDYSAIPRYLQQQYGLIHGQDHGRLWRLTHRDASSAPAADMSALDPDQLAKEIASPHFWRRQTARRLLVERMEMSVAPALSQLAREAREPAAALNALYTLDGLGVVQPEDAAAALRHPVAGVRRHGLRFAERWLDAQPALLERALAFTAESDPSLLLQLALSLGESRNARVLPALAALARAHGDVKWMPNAILSSLHQRAGEMLELLLGQAGASAAPPGVPAEGKKYLPQAANNLDAQKRILNVPGETPGVAGRRPALPSEETAGVTGQRPVLPGLGQSRRLLEPLVASISARGDAQEISRALAALARLEDASLQAACLKGFRSGLKGGRMTTLSAEGREALTRLLGSDSVEVRSAAVAVLNVADPAQRKALLARAALEAGDLKLPAESRLAAVAQLAAAEDATATRALLAAWPSNTPKVREAILEAIFSRRDRLPALLGAFEEQTIPPTALSAFQRLTMLEHDRADIRERAAKLLRKSGGAGDDVFRRFAAALNGPRDPAHGEQVFREHCATCHQTREIGFAVGPDLGAEFQRAEEAILKDILAPNETISAGYAAYEVETADGQTFTGILAGESATSLMLRQAAGLEQVILRKDIVKLSTLPVSLMPEALAQTLQPKDAADVIAWLRSASGNSGGAPDRMVLFDEEAEFIAKLAEGGGRATLETMGAFAGQAFLAVTPPQRYSANIAGWNYRIAETPGPGEYRYLRFAWRTQDGQGVMLELAASGQWPEAQDARRRYFAGRNTTQWQAREISPEKPAEWKVVTVDLWRDNGPFTLTGLAPTAMGGRAGFDRIELLRDLREIESAEAGR